MKSAAELIDNLFKSHLKPNGKEYSCQEVSKALDGKLDASYISKVRKGVIKNPGRDALLQLCLFFKVPASYFFPELEVLQTPELTETQNQTELLRVALRSLAISPQLQQHIEGLVMALGQTQTTSPQETGEAESEKS